MINPVWLETFCTLVEVKHFTRTAQILFMTQSGVSQHVNKLEQQLAQALIIRHGKQFTLTHAGERLYREGRNLLNQLNDLQQAVSYDPHDEGKIRIMSPGSVGLKLYSKVIALQKKRPKLIIDYRFAPNREVESSLLNLTSDIGLMTHVPESKDIQAISIGKEALLLVTPDYVMNPDWNTLMKLGFIDHPDGAHHTDLLLRENFKEYQNHASLFIKGFSNQIHLILAPVANGLGFTVLPEFAVDAFSDQMKINVCALPNKINESIYLCYHNNRPLLNRMQMMFEHMKTWLSCFV